MNRSTSVIIFGLALLVLACASESRAQSTTNTTSKQEAVSDALVNEVRQLRLTLQQISVNTYRGQVMVERLRLQQEQVNRLSQELNSTRSQIEGIRSEQITVKARQEEAKKQQEAGLSTELQSARYREMLETFKRAEDRLVDRESQLSMQLEEEKNNLSDLNKRMDALEREMIIKSQILDNQKPEKN